MSQGDFAAPVDWDLNDDPIYRKELWLEREEVRYGDSSMGYCTSYKSAEYKSSAADYAAVQAAAQNDESAAASESMKSAAASVASITPAAASDSVGASSTGALAVA